MGIKNLTKLIHQEAPEAIKEEKFFVDKIIIAENDEVNLKWKVLDEIYLL